MSGQRLAYAIARDRPDWADRDGLARHASRGLAIIHGPAPSDALGPGLDTLQNYAATLARLHSSETVLPLRFGSLHQDETGLDDWLRVHAHEWRRTLDEVEGCDEMGVRILLDRPVVLRPSADPGFSNRPGTAYLATLKARHDAADAVLAAASLAAERFHEALEGTFRRAVVEPPGAGRERLLSLTYLVPRSLMTRFVAVVGPLRIPGAGPPLLSGPWPPYGFAKPVPEPADTPSSSAGNNLFNCIHVA